MSEKEQAALEKIARTLPKMSDYQKAKLEGYCERVEEEERERELERFYEAADNQSE